MNNLLTGYSVRTRNTRNSLLRKGPRSCFIFPGTDRVSWLVNRYQSKDMADFQNLQGKLETLTLNLIFQNDLIQKVTILNWLVKAKS